MRRRKKWLWWFLLFGGVLALVGPSLYRSYGEMKEKRKELLRWEKQQRILSKKNRELRAEIKALNTHQEMEKLARDMGFVKKGEKAFRVIKEKNEDEAALEKQGKLDHGN